MEGILAYKVPVANNLAILTSLMDRQQLLMMVGTFLIGCFIGLYTFLVGYAPTAERMSQAVESIGTSLVITGEAYGGCDRTNSCPKFRIADDGSYRYFYVTNRADEPVLREGVLPLGIQQSLRQAVIIERLEAQSQAIEPAFCESYVDGIDVRYFVAFDNTTYILDSCGTAVQAQGELWQSLSSIWTYFERP